MTVLAFFLGFFVFVVSCFTVRFKQAMKRWMMIIGVGFLCDIIMSLAIIMFTGNLYYN